MRDRCKPDGLHDDPLATGSHGEFQIERGDAADVLEGYPAETFDSVTCDPPHGVLRQPWDVLPSQKIWDEIFRVVKKGGMLVAIGAPSTYRHMAVAVEKAGFSVEDMGAWIFATGRPAGEHRLKPAHAPILFARRPGAPGGLNIDECRLAYEDDADRDQTRRSNTLRASGKRRPGIYHDSLNQNARERADFTPKHEGRWPANVMSEERLFGEHSKYFVIPKVRDTSAHPASKPLALMVHLVKLSCPPGGIVLDPFAGSGTTGAAAVVTGRRAVLIERNKTFADTAAAKLGELVRPNERTGSDNGDDSSFNSDDFGQAFMSNKEYLRNADERARVKPWSKLLTPAQMATALGISARTFQRRRRDEPVPFVRVGRRGKRFDPEVVRRVWTEGARKEDVDLYRQGDGRFRGAGPTHGPGGPQDSQVPAHHGQAQRRDEVGGAADGGVGGVDRRPMGVRAETGRAPARRADARDRPDAHDERERLRHAADAARLLLQPRRSSS
jgi:site-specific DNA-methyltransferase (adenine-specific)